MPRYPRSTESRPSKPPTKRVAAMSVQSVETRPSQMQAESSSSGGTGWAEIAWEETPTTATKPARGPKIVEFCNKPGQFWPDGQEPPFKGQKHRRRVFVTKGKRQPREEITNNVKVINRLKEDVRPTQSFTPRTGDILLYHDYSDYEGSDEDDFFESLDDDEGVSTSVLPSLPPPIPDPPAIDDASIPSMIVEVSHAKWMDGSKVLDPDDIELLSEILDIPAAAYYKLLPPSGSVVAEFLKFKLPDMDDADFTQDPESSFNGALAVGGLRIPILIPPKAWVRSLRGALNTAIRHGKRSIIHPLLPQQPLPLWILALWEKAHVVREVHISWTNAHKWLEGKLIENPRSSSPESYDNFSAAMDNMLRLPHRKILQGQSSTGRINTSQFTRLLSDDALLSDTLIDLMVQVLNLRTHPSDKRVMILDTELPDSIRRNEMDLDKFHSLIQTLHGWKDLYFPVCIPELSHFVAFNIDFQLVSFCYGDSLHLPASKLSPFIVKLQRWLRLHFGRSFRNEGNTLQHSRQKDSVSCGLFAMNAIAHSAFLDPLGIDNPASTRAWWFKRIAGPYTSAPPPPLPASTTAPLPPLPSPTPTTAPPPPPSTQSHSLPTPQTEEVVEEKERRLHLIRRYKDKANTRAAEKARLEQDKEAQEDNMEVDVKEAQTTDVEMIDVEPLERERMEENARLEELERLKELERQKEIERREEQARFERERLEELAREEELRKKEIERREERARLEREQLEELARQEEQARMGRERLEEIARVVELGRKKEIERREEQARLESERLEELARQEQLRKKEIERREEQAHLERERLEELGREEELRKKEIERREEQARLEHERSEELARQEELKQKETERIRLEEVERQKERERVERESLKASQTLHVVPNDSMDVDIEPGEVGSEPTIKVREPSPRRARVPNVAHRSRRSISPCRQGSSSRRLPSPTRPTTYRDYAPSRLDRLPPPRRRTPSPERLTRRRRSPSPDRFTRRRRSPSPNRFAHRRRSPSPDRFARRRRSPSQDRFARRGRFPSPTGDRGYNPQPLRNQSPVRRGRRTPSPHRDPQAGPPTHLAMPPPAIVPAAHPSIPGTLALPMGFLQFRPSSTVTTVAGFNRMGSRPVENHTTRSILARITQNNDANPLSASLQSNPHNRLLNIASYPPYHLLHVISRGRLVVSKRSEIRLRLWRAQHPSAPLWFFAIRCLSRGLDWRVFANPQHLVGPMQSISGPRPAYLDHTPPLLTRGYREFDLYQDSVRDMLRLPFARRFCTMGGLVWRLAMQYGPDNLFSAALSGPSSDAYLHSNADLIGTDIDDKVMDSHLKLLLGVTVDGQSLWPPIDVFEKHMQWEGEWTASLETWFVKHCAMIQSRDTRAFATHSQWSSRLWQHSTTSSRDATRLLTEAQAQLLCYDIDQLDPKSFAALD